MIVDRSLQREILEAGKRVYPDTLFEGHDPVELWTKPFFGQNAAYLLEHGLIDATLEASFGGHTTITHFKITPKGIDFLEDDGGLSAILDKVVIKFNDTDLEKLFKSKLSESELTDAEKETIMATIKTLPAEDLKTMVTYLLNLGLKNLPDVQQLVQSIPKNRS